MKPFSISSEVTVKDILLYNPYDIETSLKTKGFKKDNFEVFFYEIPEFIDYKKKIINYISPGDYHKNFIILSGYSGTGKTTFLNWLKDKQLSEEYYFNITNLNKLPISESGINLLVKAISIELKKLYKTKDSSYLIYNNIDKIREFTTDNAFINSIYNIYFTLKNEAQITDEKINSFLNELEFKNLLFIYILEHISRIDVNDFKSLTFCFDNLDDVKFEYLTENFWDDFKEVRRNLIQFFSSNPSGINFDFQSKFSFILTFREANLIVRSSDYFDRMSGILATEKLVLTESAKKIVSKRLNFLNTYYRNVLKKSSISYLVHIISNDSYADSFYLPLFNYDYRKLMQAIVEIGISQDEKRSLAIEKNRYEQISVNSSRIARGTIIHRLIKYLFKNDYLLNFASLPKTPNLLPEKGFCRKSRLLLTIIYRFSYPNGIAKDNYRRKLTSPKRVTIYDIYITFSELFPNDIETFDLLESFFDIFKTSWTHLISIYNKSGDKIKIDFKNEKILLKNIASGNENQELLDRELRKYQVHINASGYFYLRNILIHFEYFTSLINERNGSNYKSLIESIEYDLDLGKFEFQIIIEKVIKKLTKYKINIDNFITYHIINNNKTLEWFLTEEYVFKQKPNSNPSLYITRIVSSHIEYLDRFRSLLFKDDILKNAIKNKHKSISEINEFLVLKIESYIKILDSGYKDHISPTLIKSINRRVKKQKIKGFEFWVSIISNTDIKNTPNNFTRNNK